MTNAQPVEFRRQRGDVQGDALQDRARWFSEQHMTKRCRTERSSCRCNAPAEQTDPRKPGSDRYCAKTKPSTVDVQFRHLDRLASAQRSPFARTHPLQRRFVWMYLDRHVIFLCWDEC